VPAWAPDPLDAVVVLDIDGLPNVAVPPEMRRRSRATFTMVAPRQAVNVPGAVPVRFECVEGDFTKLPIFEGLKAAASGISSGFSLDTRSREHPFAFRFRGYLRVPADGVYRLLMRSDDGSRLWNGDTLVVENDGLHSLHEESGVVALAAGLHPVTVAMFEQSGGFELAVAYAGPGVTRQPSIAAQLAIRSSCGARTLPRKRDAGPSSCGTCSNWLSRSRRRIRSIRSR
jgi:hypothetical protein